MTERRQHARRASDRPLQSKDLEWFPLYWERFIGGTKKMTLAEVGAYALLLCHSWEDGPIDGDDRAIARLINTTPAEFRKIWKAVGQKWRETEAGWINEPLEIVRAEQLAKMAANQARSSAGGKAKAAKVSASSSASSTRQAVPQAVLEAPPKQCLESALRPACDVEILELRSKKDLDQGQDQVQELPRKKRAETAVGPPDFEEFWTIYPKKEAKVKAISAWRKRRPDLVRVKAALVWQSKQPRWVKDGGEFIPHAATWLNQRRWDDEPFHAPVLDPLHANDDVWEQAGVIMGRQK